MVYLSKGAVLRPSDINIVHVSRCGREFILHDDLASLWLAGRFDIACAGSNQQQDIRKLEALGLIETAEESGNTARYRMLSNCVICRANMVHSLSLLSPREQRLWKWIKGAGVKLTISELVFLTEKDVKPVSSLFGKDNWHSLVDVIYTPETIFDGVLNALMENSPAMGKTVLTAFGLLRKKRIILI